MADDFVGKRFGKDGQVEVLSWGGYRRAKKDKVYLIKCHKCEEDSELWGGGLFEYTKGHLNEGKLPCGCSNTIYWKDWQYVIRIKRECLKRNYEFLGFVGEFKNNKTRIKLKCLIDGNEWDTTHIAAFLSGNGCPMCGTNSNRLKKTKEDSMMIKSFMESSAFIDGTEFWRSERLDSLGRTGYWHYTCPVCSNDEYVKSGLCTGIFESTRTSLQDGQHSCRCKKHYVWTQQQREYQITRDSLQDGNGVTFVRWKEDAGYTGNESKAILNCPIHGEWDVAANSYLYTKSRCPSCSKGGFRPSLDGYLYVLKIEGISGDFTGYGISNVPERRMRDHRKSLSDCGLSIQDSAIFLMDSGQQAISTEKAIKAVFPRNRQEIIGFSFEATYPHLYQNVVDFVQDQLHNTA